MLISMYEAYPQPAAAVKLTDMARDELGLVVQFVPDGQLPPPGHRPFFRFLDRTLSKTIRDRIDRPFWIDTVGASSHVDIRIDLGDAIMKVLVRRSQTYASNTHIFLLWMVTTSLVLLDRRGAVSAQSDQADPGAGAGRRMFRTRAAGA